MLPEQRADFARLFEIMAGLPVTIRLLDPPLHEFLPHEDEEFEEVAAAAGLDRAQALRRRAELHEFNPMLGHRGCRLGVTYPGNLRDAGARDLRGGVRRRRCQTGARADSRGDAPAGRQTGASSS